MAQREGTSAVYSGVLRETPAGPVAVWVTRHGVRRVGDVTPDMLDEEGSDVARSATLASALLQLREYFAGNRRKFDLSLDFSGATAFQRRIYARLLKIPYGRGRVGRAGSRSSSWPGRRRQPAPDRRSLPSGRSE